MRAEAAFSSMRSSARAASARERGRLGGELVGSGGRAGSRRAGRKGVAGVAGGRGVAVRGMGVARREEEGERGGRAVVGEDRGFWEGGDWGVVGVDMFAGVGLLRGVVRCGAW